MRDSAGNMSSYSAAGRQNEAYGSVTRVVIESSTTSSRGQQGSSTDDWKATSGRSPGYLTAPRKRPHGDDQRLLVSAARPPPGDDARSKEIAMTTDEARQTWNQQQLVQLRRPNHLDNRQPTMFMSSSVAQHTSHVRHKANVVMSSFY